MNPNNVNAPFATINNVGRDQFNRFYSSHRDIGLEELLNPVVEAAYNRGGPISRCANDTRVQAIGQIIEWFHRDGAHPVCWLSGPAGSGKSAISQTVAEKFASSSQLAGSFFFFRGAGRRSRIADFIPTIAYQLSRCLPATEPVIKHRLRTEPLIASSSISYQFTRLIVEPTTIAAPQQDILFVFDGMDECDDRESMAEFIEVMVTRLHTTPRLKIFCTSRVEEHIRGILESSVAESTTRRMNLQDFNARSDIRLFLQSRFNVIYDRNRRYMRNVSTPWPSHHDLEHLVRKCEGSFIFATTLMNFVGEGHFPHRKIEAALNMEDGLDPLYTQVLSTTSGDRNFARVVGTIMIIVQPLSVPSLGQLLRLDTEDVLQPLIGMQSILAIPGDDNQPVRLLHTSLRDFLTTERRSQQFFVDPFVMHLRTAMDCLEVVLAPMSYEIPYSEAQQYACRSWYEHIDEWLSRGDGVMLDSGDVDDLLRRLTDDSRSEAWINVLIFNSEPFDDLKTVFNDVLRKAFARNLQQIAEVVGYLLRKLESDHKDWMTTPWGAVPAGWRDDLWRRWWRLGLNPHEKMTEIHKWRSNQALARQQRHPVS